MFFQKLFSRNRNVLTAQKSARMRRSRQLALEHLETRALLSACPTTSAAVASQMNSGYYGSAAAHSSTTATQLVLLAPRGADVGVPATVELAALNYRGQIVSSFSDTVTLKSSDSAATLPSSITFVDGVAILSVTFNTAGSQTLTATDSTNTSLSARPRRPCSIRPSPRNWT